MASEANVTHVSHESEAMFVKLKLWNYFELSAEMVFAALAMFGNFMIVYITIVNKKLHSTRAFFICSLAASYFVFGTAMVRFLGKMIFEGRIGHS